MTHIKDRLERGVLALAVIDLRRRQSLDPTIGAAAERFIVDRELRELAAEAIAAGQPAGNAVVPSRKRRAVAVTAGRWFRKSSS